MMAKVKVKVVNLYSTSTRSVSMALVYSTHCLGITQFYLHTLHFICKWNELYLPLPSQLQLVLIYRPRRDGRLSRPWCKVAPAEIRTCNLSIANPALYHTATSAPSKSNRNCNHRLAHFASHDGSRISMKTDRTTNSAW